jgi:L-alanine-DL-glutamate epimerase-like enolase superfamily enzyme
MTRRSILKALGLGLASLAWTKSYAGWRMPKTQSEPVRFEMINFEPMMSLHEKIKQPVIIEKIEVRRIEKQYFVLIKSKGGDVGLIEANNRLPLLIPIFKELVVPCFLNRDARDVESLVDEVYADERNYKFAGMPFWCAVGNLEIALFDLLSRVSGKPVHDLLGKRVRERVPLYLTRLTRDTTPDEEVAAIEKHLSETGMRAVKIKVGGRMSANRDAIPNRTEKLVPLLRKKFGDSLTIYADANSSYDAASAIRVGKLLEDNGVKIWEEPCPWQDYESTKTVSDALSLPIAGGEQDTSLWQFQWMIKHRVVDVVQPDLFYNGGFVRTLRVAKMAEAAGMTIDCHSPKSGVEAYAFRAFLSVVPNIGAFQEYNYNSKAKALREVSNGSVELPTGAGLGLTYTPQMFDKSEIL